MNKLYKKRDELAFEELINAVYENGGMSPLSDGSNAHQYRFFVGYQKGFDAGVSLAREEILKLLINDLVYLDKWDGSSVAEFVVESLKVAK